MAQRPLWRVRVGEKKALSEHLVQVVLVGESLDAFPRDAEGDYIKFLLPKAPEVSIDDVSFDAPDLSGFFKRSFTVQSVGPASLTLWMTAHGGSGPAARWLRNAQAGDDCLITGPGPVARVADSASRVLLCADLPGLGGLDANLARLSAEQNALAFVEIPEASAQVPLRAPPGTEVEWLVTDASRGGVHGDALVEHTSQLILDGGEPFLWAACEYGIMKRLRTRIRENWQLDKEQYYLSSYWKLGDSDEEHKRTKKQEFPDE